MKLLFDENLSPRLVDLLSDLYPSSTHVRDVGLKTASDTQVWAFAREQGFVIVSKDIDFRQRSILFGVPPKVVGLLIGNCSTAQVESLMRTSISILVTFESDPAASFLELR